MISMTVHGLWAGDRDSLNLKCLFLEVLLPRLERQFSPISADDVEVRFPEELILRLRPVVTMTIEGLAGEWSQQRVGELARLVCDLLKEYLQCENPQGFYSAVQVLAVSLSGMSAEAQWALDQAPSSTT